MKGLFAVLSKSSKSSRVNDVNSTFKKNSEPTVIKEDLSYSQACVGKLHYYSVNNKDKTSIQDLMAFNINESNDNKKTAIIDGEFYERSNFLVKPTHDLRSKINNVKDPDVTKVNANEILLQNTYHTYKDKYLDNLAGTFTFILWDEKTRILKAAVSPLNAQTLFYTILNDTFYIASDANVLADIPGITVTVNKTAVSQWLAGRPDPSISMFNEILQIPNGHELTWNEGSITLSKFWNIDTQSNIRYSNTEDYEQHFYDLLTKSVSDRTQSVLNNKEGLLFSQMSGGMDSTSITAIANKLTQLKDIPLHTISHSYKNTKSCDEMNNISDMISTLERLNLHFIELDKFDDVSFEHLYPTHFESPGIVLSPKYHEELSLMNTLGADTLLTGNGGDEVCWGHSASYRSRLYKGELGVISEVVKACGELEEPIISSLVKLFVKPVVPNSIQNLYRLLKGKEAIKNTDTPPPPWLTTEGANLIEHCHRISDNPYHPTFEPAKYARYHSIKNTSTYNSMRSYQKVANQYAVDVKHPFFDTNIVAFSFAIPEKLLIQGSYPKWLLRKTMENYLPESVVWNKHKVVFDHHFANLVRSNAEELRKILSHEGLQELGVLDNNVLLKAFDELVENKSQHLNVDMLYAILTQSWFQTHFT